MVKMQVMALGGHQCRWSRFHNGGTWEAYECPCGFEAVVEYEPGGTTSVSVEAVRGKAIGDVEGPHPFPGDVAARDVL